MNPVQKMVMVTIQNQSMGESLIRLMVAIPASSTTTKTTTTRIASRRCPGGIEPEPRPVIDVCGGADLRNVAKVSRLSMA